MIEAVGWQYFDDYFAPATGCSTDDGLFLLQAITIDDRLYEVEKASRSFANTHVFPGGCLPSVARIADRVVARRPRCGRSGSTTSPPTTRRPWPSWRERFFGAWDRLRGEGYDERFRRLWDFYLSSSEAGFRERRIGDVQALFAKPNGTERRDAGTRDAANRSSWSTGSAPAPRSGTRSCRCWRPSAR